MKYKFDHFGIPVENKMKNMIYFPEYKVWTSDYENDPYRIEWIFFEKDSNLHPLIQSHPHICFLVKDIKKAVQDKNLLLAPVVHQNYVMAFIEVNNTPIEFIQWRE